MQDPAYKINNYDKKYPLCIVWEPFNCWTQFFFPWWGIVGVGDIGGQIHDINHDFIIGEAHKYYQMNLQDIFKYKYADAIHDADTAIRDAGFWSWKNDSHYYVATILNAVKYQEYENWNIFWVWWLTITRCRFCTWYSIYKAYKFWFWIGFFLLMTYGFTSKPEIPYDDY
jgi:hypothetical protein